MLVEPRIYIENNSFLARVTSFRYSDEHALESVNMCTGIDCFGANSDCLRSASASSNRSGKAITSPDSTEPSTRRDLYDLYKTGIELWLSSVKRNMRPSCDDKSALLSNAASRYAVILSEL